MKTFFSKIAILTLALSGLACSSTQVQRVHDPEFDFSGGKTFRWGEQELERGGDVSWEMIDRAVKSIVQATMQLRGLTQADADAAYELYYFIGADEVNQISSNYGAHYYGMSFGYWGSARGPGAYAQDARIYDQGSFTLDVVDAESGSLVWRGTSQGTIKPNTLPKERRKNIERAINELLATFPPKGS